jgi:hypothetical protein
MPAIASLEELKMVRRDFRSMFLVVTPNDLRLTMRINALRSAFLMDTNHVVNRNGLFVFRCLTPYALRLTTHASR